MFWVSVLVGLRGAGIQLPWGAQTRPDLRTGFPKFLEPFLSDGLTATYGSTPGA